MRPGSEQFQSRRTSSTVTQYTRRSTDAAWLLSYVQLTIDIASEVVKNVGVLVSHCRSTSRLSVRSSGSCSWTRSVKMLSSNSIGFDFSSSRSAACSCLNKLLLRGVPHFLIEWFFRLDALAWSVIATATWLGGWLAVTLQYCIKTAKPIGKLFRPSESPITLVFCDPWADTKFQGKPLQRGR